MLCCMLDKGSALASADMQDLQREDNNGGAARLEEPSVDRYVVLRFPLVGSLLATVVAD
jgi:hypothetical protein